jgi:hypothetical protein
MFSEIVNMARGQVQTLNSTALSNLTEELSDFGIECATVHLNDLGNDGAFVELLNKVRLADQLLVLSARLDDPALIWARYNIDHCFSKFGGRAILVAA